jgi:putative tryptophan/tyrosine transport system substrate-binding protein
VLDAIAFRGDFARAPWQQQFDAAMVDEGGSFLAHPALIAELAEKYRLPMIYPYRDYVDLGGLMGYAPDLGELAERLANDVHQILGGAKPAISRFTNPPNFNCSSISWRPGRSGSTCRRR